jgi:hypothetical protein
MTAFDEIELQLLRALEVAVRGGQKDRTQKIEAALRIVREVCDDPPRINYAKDDPEARDVELETVK